MPSSNSPSQNQAAEWRALVLKETRRTGHALLGLLHAKRANPELWAAINGQARTEDRQQQFDFEQQDINRIDRQR